MPLEQPAKANKSTAAISEDVLNRRVIFIVYSARRF